MHVVEFFADQGVALDPRDRNMLLDDARREGHVLVERLLLDRTNDLRAPLAESA